PLLACGHPGPAQPPDACADPRPVDGQPDASPPVKTTIAFDFDIPPLLAVFRASPTAAWQTATMVTPMHYTFDVTGPYLAAAVVNNGTAAAPTYETLEYAQTPEDDTTITVVTNYTPPTGSHVTGTVATPGRIWAGDAEGVGSAAGWSFDLTVSPG